MIFNERKIKTNRGQAMLTATVFFIVLSLTIIVGLSGIVASEARIAGDTFRSKESFFLAEAGVEDVVYRLKNGITVSSGSETISLNGHTATTEIVAGSDSRTVTSTGDADDRMRKLCVDLKAGKGVAFSYAIHVGAGGFTLSNNATVIGGVYSNGSIIGASGASITGGATAVNEIRQMIVGSGGSGDAWAPNVTNSSVFGDLYCQTGSGNNKPCDTSRANPPQQDFPISLDTINTWKSEAESGGVIASQTINGAGNMLGPKKIAGNLTINSGAELVLTGTIWVTGNINLGINSIVRLDSAYGGASGMIISDGRIDISNNASFAGSGVSGSNLMVMSTSDCPASSSCGGADAIRVGNNGGAVILNAQNGTIHFSNNANADHISAKTVYLANNASLEYKSGLINAYFSSGPSGGWEIQSWKEIE